MIVTRGLGSPLLATRGYGGVRVGVELVPPFSARFRVCPARSDLDTAILDVVVLSPSGVTSMQACVSWSELHTGTARTAILTALSEAGFDTPVGSLITTTVRVGSDLSTSRGSTTFGT